jgi:hypothetical protein
MSIGMWRPSCSARAVDLPALRQQPWQLQLRDTPPPPLHCLRPQVPLPGPCRPTGCTAQAHQYKRHAGRCLPRFGWLEAIGRQELGGRCWGKWPRLVFPWQLAPQGQA